VKLFIELLTVPDIKIDNKGTTIKLIYTKINNYLVVKGVGL